MAGLDKEEQDLLKSYESDEWVSVPDKEKKIEKYREYAKATFRKDRRINIRISSRDLEAIQKRALMEGIPYQTLIASILHKYADGRLQDKTA